MLFKKNHFAAWSAICWLAAMPSFILGFRENADGFGMVAGIMLFVSIYTLLTSSVLYERLKAKPVLNLTLRIAFGVRLLISFIGIVIVLAHQPIEQFVFVDAVSGLLSIRTTEYLTGLAFIPRSDMPGMELSFFTYFLLTLLTTIIQGILLNLVIAVAVAILFPFVSVGHKMLSLVKNDKPL